MALKESWDMVVRNAAPTLATGRKFSTSTRYQCQVQQGREGFTLVTSKPTWQKATPAERQQLVVEKGLHQEEAARMTKAVSQAKQGRWDRMGGH